jgi:hypothetical protein
LGQAGFRGEKGEEYQQGKNGGEIFHRGYFETAGGKISNLIFLQKTTNSERLANSWSARRSIENIAQWGYDLFLDEGPLLDFCTLPDGIAQIEQA